MLIDTHAHLNFPDYKDISLSDILDRAQKENVEIIINVGTDKKTSMESLLLAEKNPAIYASVGIHPQEAHKADSHSIEYLHDFIRGSDKVVAIGEIGLDYFKMNNSHLEQQKIFKELLTLAKDLNLSYIVHNRDANVDVIKAIKEVNYYHGVMHCFSGDLSFATEVLQLGLLLSFTGIVTFKNAVSIQKVAASVPLDRILLETDSPFLAPHPKRGQRNEPAYVSLIAAKIAELRQEKISKVSETTTNTALNFFKISI